MQNQRQVYLSLWLLAVALVAMVWVQQFAASRATTQDLSYSEFLDQLRDGNLDHIVVGPDEIIGELLTRR